MSSITFKALINDIHFDPKKGTLKIQLIAANYVSLDKLATLGPHDENVQVTLKSAQTNLADAEAPISLDEKAANILREAGKKLRDPEEEGKIATEYPPIPGAPEVGDD